MRIIKLLLIGYCILFYTKAAIAEENGTREQAEQLLERAEAIFNIDKNRALDLFTTGNGGMIINDLYVFCSATDGTITAHPGVVGINIYKSGIKDLNGNNLAEVMAKEAQFGVVKEIQYKLRKYNTSSEEEFLKTTLYTKLGDQVCGVGYYN